LFLLWVILLFVAQNIYAQCPGVSIRYFKNIDPDTVQVQLYRTIWDDTIVSYEYGPSGFELGTGVMGTIIMTKWEYKLNYIDLIDNQEYDLYLCGEYRYSFSSVMSLECFEDNFDDSDHLFGGWKTRKLVPGIQDQYSYFTIGSHEYGNDTKFFKMMAGTPTWFSVPWQYGYLVSPEIQVIKDAQPFLLEFDVAADGIVDNFGYSEANPYLPRFAVFLRSEGIVDQYTGWTGDSDFMDSLIVEPDNLVHKDFIHVSKWIIPSPGYSSVLFKLWHSMGSISLDNIQISDGSGICIDLNGPFVEYEEDFKHRTRLNQPDQFVPFDRIPLTIIYDPGGREVELLFDQDQESVLVMVYNIQGVVLFKKVYTDLKDISIDVEHLAPAPYFVRIRTEEGDIIKQLIKQ